MRVISQPKPDQEYRFTCRGRGAELAAIPSDARNIRGRPGEGTLLSLTCCVCGRENVVIKAITGWR